MYMKRMSKCATERGKEGKREREKEGGRMRAGERIDSSDYRGRKALSLAVGKLETRDRQLQSEFKGQSTRRGDGVKF